MRVKFVKHASDKRYKAAQIRSHDGRCMEQAEVESSLTDVDFSDTDVVAIDELHFFKNVAEGLRHMQQAGVRVLATTLNTGMLGEEFHIWKQLREAKLCPEVRHLTANCDVC